MLADNCSDKLIQANFKLYSPLSPNIVVVLLYKYSLIYCALPSLLVRNLATVYLKIRYLMQKYVHISYGYV